MSRSVTSRSSPARIRARPTQSARLQLEDSNHSKKRSIHDETDRAARISDGERNDRLKRLRALMSENGVTAVLLGPTTSLRYFTGVMWNPSERFTGAIVFADGRIEYVCPRFELDKVGGLVRIKGDILTWQEEENPYALIADHVGPSAKIGVDNQVALFTYRGLAQVIDPARLADVGPLITHLRARKSPAEIALMQYAKTITLEVQRRT